MKLIKNPSYSSIICGLCDRDLKNFCDLKKDLSSKQNRLYEDEPIFEPLFKVDPADYEAIVVEALEDEGTMGISEVFFGDFHSDETISVSTKSRTKQALSTPSVTPSMKKSQLKEKLFCNECGISLANNISLKRHIDRVRCS